MNRGLQILFQKHAKLIRPVFRNITTTPAKHSGEWVYRSSGANVLPKKHYLLADSIGAIMWYWILIHLWHEPEHILGDFPYPDPSKWTDAELGVTE